MPQTLADYLKEEGARKLRYLLRELEGVTAEDANRFRDPDWPGHEYGIGQDGSLAGLVYHVAAWKQLTLPMLAPGGEAIPLEAFDPTTAPALEDWEGLMAWLQNIGTAWQAALEALPEAAFEETRTWFDRPIPLTRYITEMMEHDVAHASQVEYLKQRLKRLE